MGAYSGPERRKNVRPAADQRAEIAVRLLVTTERLERLAHRLESYVDAPQNNRKKKS